MIQLPANVLILNSDAWLPNSNMTHDLRFIADAMLGRLARWLRLLGFDTLYYPDISDGDLVRLAVKEERLILTRDTHFLKIKNLQNLLTIKSDYPVEQVIEVLKAFKIEAFGISRCTCCNGILCCVDEKEMIRDKVPEYIYFNCSNFMECISCGNVYWEGSHLKKFRAMLDNIK